MPVLEPPVPAPAAAEALEVGPVVLVLWPEVPSLPDMPVLLPEPVEEPLVPVPDVPMLPEVPVLLPDVPMLLPEVPMLLPEVPVPVDVPIPSPPVP